VKIDNRQTAVKIHINMHQIGLYIVVYHIVGRLLHKGFLACFNSSIVIHLKCTEKLALTRTENIFVALVGKIACNVGKKCAHKFRKDVEKRNENSSRRQKQKRSLEKGLRIGSILKRKAMKQK